MWSFRTLVLPGGLSGFLLKCWHVLSLGRVWWEWCDGVCLLLWCGYLLCGLPLFPAVVFCCCMSFVHCKWCRLSRSCLAVACLIRPCVYLACLTSLHTSFLPNLPLLFQWCLQCRLVDWRVLMPSRFCWPCCIRHYVIQESSDAASCMPLFWQTACICMILVWPSLTYLCVVLLLNTLLPTLLEHSLHR